MQVQAKCMATFTALFLLLLSCFTNTSRSQEPIEGAENEKTLMDRIHQRWTGDFDEIRKKRRVIRVLVSYNSTNFFVVQGQPRGLEYELLHQYERFLNKGVLKLDGKTYVAFISVPFKKLLPALIEGRGDIAAAGLTITPERRKLVAFTRPYIRDVNEILVTSKSVDYIKSTKDLSGCQVRVVSGSSYVQHLKRLNKSLAREGLKPVNIIEMDKNLESEDILQMVNSGIFDMTVVDNHIAEIWSRVLTNLVLRKDVAINTGGHIAWAVRKENPELLSSLNQYIRKHGQGTYLGNILIKRYYKNTKWIKNPIRKAEQKKLEKLISLFKKYSKIYCFDWLQIAALAYQESGLDQSAISPQGAVGIMQILPKTAAGPHVRISDVHSAENNIHAGVKYLAALRDRYFNESGISPAAKIDFTFAAYNAGPTRVRSLRKRARKLGLDPDRWFFNVEHVASRVIGGETVQYVANVNKYYIAYRSIAKSLGERLKNITNNPP